MDKMVVFSGTANKKLSEKISKSLKIKLGELAVSRFSDGEIGVKVQENVRGKDVFIIQPTCPPVTENLTELLIILDALMDGNLQPPGTTILQRTDKLTVYEVNKFEDDICEIPISLERWCRNSGSMEKLKEATVIDGRTAEILEPLRPISINHKESKGKKAKAFQLFSEGKRPGDSEVKSLGSKPNSAYRYYQHWKKAH